MKRMQREENVKYNGELYLFNPPRKDFFEGSAVPSYLSTPKRWTKMILSVKDIDDYKKIMNYLFLETHRYPLQEDTEADSVIIQTFNRDLVYYNNMCINKVCVVHNICSFYS